MAMKKIFKELFNFSKLLLITYVIIALVSNFIFTPVMVRGSSMRPTLEDGDIGLSYVITKNLLGLHRGAVVTVYIPKEKQSIVKRVIALPGETVYVKDGSVYVNDEILDEPYLENDFKAEFEESTGLLFTGDFPKVKVPEDQYFLLGDNRPNSLDSRAYGPFDQDHIKSNSLIILYPFKNFGIK